MYALQQPLKQTGSQIYQQQVTTALQRALSYNTGISTLPATTPANHTVLSGQQASVM